MRKIEIGPSKLLWVRKRDGWRREGENGCEYQRENAAGRVEGGRGTGDGVVEREKEREEEREREEGR